MLNRSFEYYLNDLNLSVKKIESLMGYKEGENSEVVTGIIEEILAEPVMQSSIKAQYKIFENPVFNYYDKSFEIVNTVFHVKNIIYNQIYKSDSIAIFLCTAGEAISELSGRAMKGKDILRGYICDVIGNEIVETAVELMQNTLENEMIGYGKKITNRFSPGYCGWDVVEQQKLFALVPDNVCNIKLSDSSLMDPLKSVSGIIGSGANVIRSDYTCHLCDQKDCIYRKKNNQR
jgi:hypothetical protein